MVCALPFIEITPPETDQTLPAPSTSWLTAGIMLPLAEARCALAVWVAMGEGCEEEVLAELLAPLELVLAMLALASVLTAPSLAPPQAESIRVQVRVRALRPWPINPRIVTVCMSLASLEGETLQVLRRGPDRTENRSRC
jgi:hypothetical protein